MRNIIIAPNEHYHIFNRGNNKQLIFLDDRDRKRFLFLILCLQSTTQIPNMNRFIANSNTVQHSVLNIPKNLYKKLVIHRYVKLINFACMPNHFHLTVQEMNEGGISRYMQRLLNAYTKYFNTKYKRLGHLFQGPYRAVHIGDNDQLLYLSAYIHCNPKEITRWRDSAWDYPWSSYQDYIKTNRWNDLLHHAIIRDQFSNGKEYKKFVETSGAKEIEINLDETHLFNTEC